MHRLSRTTKDIDYELEQLDEEADGGDQRAAAAARALRWAIGETAVCPCQVISTARYFESTRSVVDLPTIIADAAP